MEFSYRSDKGRARTINQDFSHGEILSESYGEIGIFVVADGMGGHNKGEVASKLATEVFVNNIKNKLAEENKVSLESLKEIIGEAFEDANVKVYLKSTADETFQGMGTTLVVALTDEKKLIIANAGDSRAYILRGDDFEQITVDNSYVQELVAGGVIAPEEARNHPDKRKITRAVGTECKIEVDFYDIQLKKGDKILLCSDGLSDMLEKEEIKEILHRSVSADSCCEHLVNVANHKGGRDNITVICLTI